MDGATGILVGGGVAAVLAAAAGGGLKAFGVELPHLASAPRQILLLAVGIGLIALGLVGDGGRGGLTPAVTAARTPAPGPGAAARQARSVPPPVPELAGMGFTAARQLLIGQGWKPVEGLYEPLASVDIGVREDGVRHPQYREALCQGEAAAPPCLVRYGKPGYVLEAVVLGRSLAEGRIDMAGLEKCAERLTMAGC